MLARLADLLERTSEDVDAHGLAVEHLRADPEAWARPVTEWGLTLRPVRPTMEQAQVDAMTVRSEVVALGLTDQAEAQASAVGVMERTRWLRRWRVTGWRGSLHLEFQDSAAFARRVRDCR